MTFTLITYAVDDAIATITLNRPDKMNALNITLLGELDKAMDAAISNDDVRGIIITGSGNKAFAAGADIAEFANFTEQQAKEMSANGHRIFNKIESSPKPVIAAVNGYALGGGCELAMACHMRIATEEANFGQPEINLGLIPGYGGTQRLVRLIGYGKAVELLLTSNMIGANEAHRFGLVNHVTGEDQLLNECRSILNKVQKKSPLAVKQIIDCANAFNDKDRNGFELEVEEFGNCFNTQDFKEGTKAFLEKRKPQFTGK